MRRSSRGKRRHLPSYVEDVRNGEESNPHFAFCDIAPLLMNGISTIRDDQVRGGHIRLDNIGDRQLRTSHNGLQQVSHHRLRCDP